MSDGKSKQSALLLSVMMALVPALGYPREDLLQDTLKSMLVSFFVLGATFLFFWKLRSERGTVRIHVLMALPLGLMLFALTSMVWSHTYLAGVEAIRWYLFSLIFLLGLNCFNKVTITQLTWGIHLGAVIASFWTALQFWFDFKFFAQGPNPASTFVNRNFFAEFVVCSIPFSVLLLTRVKDKTSVFFLTFSIGFNIVALLQTGTRSALFALGALAMMLPIVVYALKEYIAPTGWNKWHGTALLTLMIFSILSLGSLQTHNKQLIREAGKVSAIDRAFTRTLSIANTSEYTTGSLSIRMAMWRATWRMIKTAPMSGVGAGGWEVHIPAFQEQNTSLETDYYAHNEYLQLVAEYGILGWLFLGGLFSYLFWAARITWSQRTSEHGQQHTLVRATALASLMALLIVSAAGFPWRLATTGALFSLSLSILAASDSSYRTGALLRCDSVILTQKFFQGALCALGASCLVAIYIANRAIECESKLVRAIKMSMLVSMSGNPNESKWADTRMEIIQLMRDGTRINRHYRKLTPIVADTLASWGDWKNATWIWESVLDSRPDVVALLANAARGELQEGNFVAAERHLQHAIVLRPNSPILKSLQVLLWSKTERKIEASSVAAELLQGPFSDPALLEAAYLLGIGNKDAKLAIRSLDLQILSFPDQSESAWKRLHTICDEATLREHSVADECAQGATTEVSKPEISQHLPMQLQNKVN